MGFANRWCGHGMCQALGRCLRRARCQFQSKVRDFGLYEILSVGVGWEAAYPLHRTRPLRGRPGPYHGNRPQQKITYWNQYCCRVEVLVYTLRTYVRFGNFPYDRGYSVRLQHCKHLIAFGRKCASVVSLMCLRRWAANWFTRVQLSLHVVVFACRFYLARSRSVAMPGRQLK